MSKLPLNSITAKLPASVPFVGPEIQERELGRPFILRLGANENTLGPSPKAVVAMQQAAGDLWMYGDSVSYDLRVALADFHQVGIENIVIGEGIDALLGYTCRLFVEPGRNIVTSKGAYPTFNFHVAGNGGTLHFVDMNNYHEDLDQLISKKDETDAVLTYCSNPNNPMGSWHDRDQIERLIASFSGGNILVLDEAYIEFAPDGTAPGFDIRNSNVLRFRTFSKAYAMAGARIGYCIGSSDLIAEMEKVRNHFGVNRVAQIGAKAALEDQEYLNNTRQAVSKGRLKIAAIAKKYNLEAYPSATNFVAIDCKRDETFARQIVDRLTEKAVFIRMPSIAPHIGFIRVSVGPDDQLDLFDQMLGEVLAELN